VPRAERRAKIALEEVVAAATLTRQFHWRQQHADPNRAAEFHRLQKMTLLLPGPNAYIGAADVGVPLAGALRRWSPSTSPGPPGGLAARVGLVDSSTDRCLEDAAAGGTTRRRRQQAQLDGS
jgi:hypothetical protein